MRKSSLLLIFVLVLFFSPSLLKADEGVNKGSNNLEEEYRQKLKKAVTEESPEEQFKQEFDFYHRFISQSGAKSQDGHVGINESAFEYSYDLKLFNKLPVQLAVGASEILIENTSPVTLPAHLTDLTFAIESTFPFLDFNKTYLRVGISPSFLTDNWNFNTRSFTIPSRIFLIHQANDKLTLVAGVSIYPDNNTPVFPIVGFIYKPNDRLMFEIVPRRPTISYKLTNKWTIFGEGDITYSQYWIKRNERDKIAIEFHETSCGMGIKYTFNKFAQASLSTGAVFGRYLKYDPDSLGKVDIDNGIYTEFRLQINM